MTEGLRATTRPPTTPTTPPHLERIVLMRHQHLVAVLRSLRGTRSARRQQGGRGAAPHPLPTRHGACCASPASAPLPPPPFGSSAQQLPSTPQLPPTPEAPGTRPAAHLLQHILLQPGLHALHAGAVDARVLQVGKGALRLAHHKRLAVDVAAGGRVVEAGARVVSGSAAGREGGRGARAAAPAPQAHAAGMLSCKQPSCPPRS